jgi:hypothetical protein
MRPTHEKNLMENKRKGWGNNPKRLQIYNGA